MTDIYCSRDFQHVKWDIADNEHRASDDLSVAYGTNRRLNIGAQPPAPLAAREQQEEPARKAHTGRIVPRQYLSIWHGSDISAADMRNIACFVRKNPHLKPVHVTSDVRGFHQQIESLSLSAERPEGDCKESAAARFEQVSAVAQAFRSGRVVEQKQHLSELFEDKDAWRQHGLSAVKLEAAILQEKVGIFDNQARQSDIERSAHLFAHGGVYLDVGDRQESTLPDRIDAPHGMRVRIVADTGGLGGNNYLMATAGNAICRNQLRHVQDLYSRRDSLRQLAENPENQTRPSGLTPARTEGQQIQRSAEGIDPAVGTQAMMYESRAPRHVLESQGIDVPLVGARFLYTMDMAGPLALGNAIYDHLNAGPANREIDHEAAQIAPPQHHVLPDDMDIAEPGAGLPSLSYQYTAKEPDEIREKKLFIDRRYGPTKPRIASEFL